MNKAVFLDRDGVIIQEHGHYNYLPEHRLLVTGIIELLKDLQKKGYLLFVVTNQGGIEKGLYTHDDVSQMHQFIENELNRAEIYIKQYYYCPHHATISACLCRKPGHVLIQKALYTYQVDVSASYMIGDKDTDVQAAENAGLTGILIPANNLDSISKIITP